MVIGGTSAPWFLSMFLLVKYLSPRLHLFFINNPSHISYWFQNLFFDLFDGYAFAFHFKPQFTPELIALGLAVYTDANKEMAKKVIKDRIIVGEDTWPNRFFRKGNYLKIEAYLLGSSNNPVAANMASSLSR